MLAFEEWRQKFQSGDLNDVQSQFFRARPAEQLFDIENDPHEVNNLANDPAYAEQLKELRSEMTNWVTSMPDLSVYPESVLAAEAFSNPVEFGQAHKKDIAKILAVADLQLVSFQDAESRLRAAMKSDDPHVRLWAMITCSHFAKEASALAGAARDLMSNDDNRLVRIRATEFLGLIGEVDPAPVFRRELKSCEDGIEAGLILNSLTLLRDGSSKNKFDVRPNWFHPDAVKNETVQRRLEYLGP